MFDTLEAVVQTPPNCSTDTDRMLIPLFDDAVQYDQSVSDLDYDSDNPAAELSIF